MGKSAGGGGGDIYGQAAGALQGAGGLVNNAANRYGNVRAPGDPRSVMSGLSEYMNPFTNKVINRSMTDFNRFTDQQDALTAANADAVGAFGGSRQGVVEALTRSEAQKNFGDLSAGLRMQGFDTATGLSQQDIANEQQAGQFRTGTQLQKAGGMAGLAPLLQSLGTTGFNMGQTIGNQQMQQGGLQQALLQRILGGAGEQFQGFLAQPMNLLNMQLGALGMNPLGNATKTTSTTTPGLFDYLSLASQAYGASPPGTIFGMGG
jgi:hypothetical protein